MSRSETANRKSMTPPLSPVLFAGMALRPMPLALLQPALKLAMNTIQHRHPEVFDRLSCLEDPVYLIDPVDLPFVFILRPDPLLPTLHAERDAMGIEVTATVRGPLMALIGLLEGTTDGDALFFSRDLIVEGDTEAVVALRNAVDGAEIDVLEDLLAALGPLARPAKRVVGGVTGLFSMAARDLETVRNAMIAPAVRQSEIQAAKIKKMDEKVTAMGRQSRRQRGRNKDQ